MYRCTASRARELTTGTGSNGAGTAKVLILISRGGRDPHDGRVLLLIAIADSLVRALEVPPRLRLIVVKTCRTNVLGVGGQDNRS